MTSTALDRTPTTIDLRPVARDTLPPAGLFITGTDTGVGKTFITAALVELLRRDGHRVGAYKPVATGLGDPPCASPESDPEILRRAAGPTATLHDVCPQRFAAPAAPPVAAAAEGRSVDPRLSLRGAQRWRDHCDLLMVEGVGGLLCPLTEHLTVADFAQQLAFPLLVVARATLGTLNHTLLTVEVARQRGLNVAAIILNAPQPVTGSLADQTNAHQLRRRVDCPLIEMPHLAQHSSAQATSRSPSSRPLQHHRHNAAHPSNPAHLLSRHDWPALAGVR